VILEDPRFVAKEYFAMPAFKDTAEFGNTVA
jgi:hypothetical protein